jgi:capsular polysaccharide biosynthesis protein
VPRSVRDEEAFERRINAAKLAEVIHPERLDFERQIEQLQSAALVSGCEGSAFHSLIFVEGVRTSLIFCAQLPPMSYFLCDELIDGDVVYLRCNASPPEQGDPRKTPWVLNTNKAYRLLEFLGRVLN